MNTLSRREVIQAIAATAAVPIACAHANNSAAPVAAEVRRAHPIVPEMIKERFASLPLESQDIRGLLADRMKINVQGRLLHIDEKTFLEGFTHHHRTDDFLTTWVGEHAGKFLDAACNSLRYRENVDLRRLIERVAKTLIGSQGDDGYLGTYTDDRRWTAWDVWVHKYDLIGLLSYYESSGDEAALAACRKIGDLLCRTFGDGPEERSLVFNGSTDSATAVAAGGMSATSILEPICTLYRFTGEDRYLTFARYIIRSHEQPHGPDLLNWIVENGTVFGGSTGHAYNILSNLNGILDLYRLIGDEKLLKVVTTAWDSIRAGQLYITGAVCAAEGFQTPGRLLSLPSSDVGETCATVTWIQFTWRLFRLTAEARYGQEIERAVYNHLLAAQDPSTGDFCYYTAFAGKKEFTAAPLCCVSSGPRGISLIPKLVWGVESDAFVINLYTQGHARFKMNGVPVEIVSDTEYPLTGDITLQVNPQRAVPFTLRLRVPQWVTVFEVIIGAEKLQGIAGQMLDITQTWQSSSVVRIRMDMAVRVVDGGLAYPDYVALQRGPQILALERALNHDVPYLSRTALPKSNQPPAMSSVATQERIGRRQIYAVNGIAGMPESSRQLRLENRRLVLVPFADARDYQVWLTKAERLRRDVPAVTIFERAFSSHIGSSNDGADRAAANTSESITDDNPNTCCTVDLKGLDITSFFPNVAEKKAGAVWFGVRLSRPATISRVVFTHGVAGPEGGWFDTSRMKPRLEVIHQMLPVWSQDMKAWKRPPVWEEVAVFDCYPETDHTQMPACTEGHSFEVRLTQPVQVCGIRIVGIPARDTVNCAELSAYA